jgi:hypothetical protein
MFCLAPFVPFRILLSVVGRNGVNFWAQFLNAKSDISHGSLAYRGFESHPIRSKLLARFHLAPWRGVPFSAPALQHAWHFCQCAPIPKTVRKKRDRARWISVH